MFLDSGDTHVGTQNFELKSIQALPESDFKMISAVLLIKAYASTGASSSYLLKMLKKYIDET